MNLGSGAGSSTTSSSSPAGRSSKSSTRNNNNNNMTNNEYYGNINHLHDEQFDPSSMNSLESLRRRELVSSELADMFLGFPYDKYPETEQSYSSTTTNQNDFGGGGRGAAVPQKPLTEAQQEAFACF